MTARSGIWRVEYLPRGHRTPQVENLWLPSRQAVRHDVAERGGVVLSIRPYRAPQFALVPGGRRKFRSRLLRAISHHSNDSTSSGRALWRLIEAEGDRRRRALLDPALQVLKRGGQLAEALDATGIFEPGTVAILAAGQASGNMRSVLEHAAKQVEHGQSIWKQFRAPLAWLAFDLAAAITTVPSLLFGYLPWVRDNGIETRDPVKLAEFNRNLDIAFAANWFLFMLLAALTVATLVLSLGYAANISRPRNVFARIVYRLPLVGSIIQSAALGNAFAVLAQLVEGGVAAVLACSLAAKATMVGSVREMLRVAAERMETGATVDMALKSPLISSVEQFELAANRSVRHFATLVRGVAVQRNETVQLQITALVVAVTTATLAFIMLSVVSAIGVLFVHYESLMASMNAIGN